MIDKKMTYNDEYLVILPIKIQNMQSAFEYTFKNIFIYDYLENPDSQLNIINNSNFKQIIFVDYLPEYLNIINKYKNNHTIKFIYTKSLGSFSDVENYRMFNEIINLYEKKIVDKIAFLDSNLYKLFKKKYNCCTLFLDIEKNIYSNKYNKKRIGLLNDSNNPNHSFYNELSALAFNKYKASLKSIDKRTKKFTKLFGIKYTTDRNKYMDNNVVNLYINFTDNNNILFLESMDREVPCILGNNDLIQDSSLKKYLMLESDDSIDEIKDKIELVKNNRESIIKEYKIFREDYSKKSKESVEDFLEYKMEEPKKIEYQKLLSIVVPVYNTEKYLKKCLDSIIKAIPNEIKDKTEILIINDGSTDNSETIIKEYETKYNFIKYIFQKNRGLGNVRNVGLKNAKGKYIASIDSDDSINKNFFKECLNDLKNDIDVVIYDWLTVTNETKYETSAIEWIFNKKYNKYEGLMYTTIMPSTCNKIFKKELYDDLKIEFVEDKYEDLSTNPFILLKAKKIKYYKKPYYEYYIRSDSYMRTPAGLSMIHILKEFSKRFNKYKEFCNIDVEKFMYYTLSWRIEEYVINQIYEKNPKELDEYLNYVYESIYDIIKQIFNNKYYLEMVNSLDENKKEYIINRNKSFIEKDLKNFLKEKKEPVKLNAPIIYFGDKM